MAGGVILTTSPYPLLPITPPHKHTHTHTQNVPPPVRRNGQLIASIKIRLEGIKPHAQRVAIAAAFLLLASAAIPRAGPGPVGRHDPAPISGKISQCRGQGGVARGQQHVRRPLKLVLQENFRGLQQTKGEEKGGGGGRQGLQ